MRAARPAVAAADAVVEFAGFAGFAVCAAASSSRAMPEALVVVDGNNVMGSRPDGWWRDRAGAARRLVAQLGEWAAVAERDVLVVFDGAPPAGLAAPTRVEVRFARRRGPDAADDEIAAFVAADAAPERLRVVTSDARLARRVRAHGAEVVGARELLDQF
jgi:predicted RNA-binding protein with PIN domain